jgi:hypothetical protein
MKYWVPVQASRYPAMTLHKLRDINQGSGCSPIFCGGKESYSRGFKTVCTSGLLRTIHVTSSLYEAIIHNYYLMIIPFCVTILLVYPLIIFYQLKLE